MVSLDVIIPCLGSCPALPAAALSALGDPALAVRILILLQNADVATMMAAERLALDARVSLIRHDPPIPAAALCNEGLAWAEAPYLVILPPDHILLPTVGGVVEMLEDWPDVAFAYGPCGRSGTPTVPPGRPVIRGGGDFATLLARCGRMPAGAHAAVIRHAALDAIGGFRSRSLGIGQTALMLRLARRGCVARLRRPVVARRPLLEKT